MEKWWRILNEGVNCTGGYGCLQEVLINDTSAEFDNLDYRVGLDFDLDDNTLLYAYYATGFKSGSIQDVYRRGIILFIQRDQVHMLILHTIMSI